MNVTHRAVLAHERPISVQVSALCILNWPLQNPLKHWKQSEEVTEVSGFLCALADLSLKQPFRRGNVGFCFFYNETSLKKRI